MRPQRLDRYMASNDPGAQDELWHFLLDESRTPRSFSNIAARRTGAGQGLSKRFPKLDQVIEVMYLSTTDVNALGLDGLLKLREPLTYMASVR